jgi:hypothetical protein
MKTLMAEGQILQRRLPRADGVEEFMATSSDSASCHRDYLLAKSKEKDLQYDGT